MLPVMWNCVQKDKQADRHQTAVQTPDSSLETWILFTSVSLEDTVFLPSPSHITSLPPPPIPSEYSFSSFDGTDKLPGRAD